MGLKSMQNKTPGPEKADSTQKAETNPSTIQHTVQERLHGGPCRHSILVVAIHGKAPRLLIRHKSDMIRQKGKKKIGNREP